MESSISTLEQIDSFNVSPSKVGVLEGAQHSTDVFEFFIWTLISLAEVLYLGTIGRFTDNYDPKYLGLGYTAAYWAVNARQRTTRHSEVQLYLNLLVVEGSAT